MRDQSTNRGGGRDNGRYQRSELSVLALIPIVNRLLLTLCFAAFDPFAISANLFSVMFNVFFKKYIYLLFSVNIKTKHIALTVP